MTVLGALERAVTALEVEWARRRAPKRLQIGADGLDFPKPPRHP